MFRALSILAWVCLNLHLGSGDVYLHNPRGSNNRYNENSLNRRNANRMFNSENNARGGYNVGSLYYHVGSKLQLEWTNQHSCGDQNANCDIVLQYTCGNLVRDGTTSATIPSNPVLCNKLDCNTDRRYGMHEDFYSYAHCRLRSRNHGLFAANQKVTGGSAAYTRQNRNGNRYGLECSEERDYYPYWGPTQWRDIAILTTDVSKCSTYQKESQNVKAKYACKVGITYLYQNAISKPRSYIPITQEECESFTYTESGVTKNGTWERYEAFGINPPECFAAPPTRDNHLGNTVGGHTLNYNWTIPDFPSESCALRIRYNISTTDYDGATTNSSYNNRLRGRNPGVKIWERYGLDKREGTQRGFWLVNDPIVDIFNSNKLKLRLAINTGQYGRTFQDRSHIFAIRPRPEGIPKQAEILNINVRGRRGNIVQVYPSVEYDFVPNTALVRTNSYVHYQWTGSNNNPRGNVGQGAVGTDRNNLVLINEPFYVKDQLNSYRNNTYGQYGSNYPAPISRSALGGLSREDIIKLATSGQSLGGDMSELDDAGTYFDLGLRKVTMPGTYQYMCTRNNNFSNRSQKGKLVVTNSDFRQQSVDRNGAVVVVTDVENRPLTSVSIPPQALMSAQSVELWELSPEDSSAIPPPPNKDLISRMIFFGPVVDLTNGNESLTVEIRLRDQANALHELCVFRSTNDGKYWEKLKIEKQESDMVSVRTTKGGYFVATKHIASSALAGLVVGLLVAFIIIVAISVQAYRKRLVLSGFGEKI